MAPRESEPQKETVERVMHEFKHGEFKHGELRSGASGQKVKDRRQAVAIALSEAGASNQQTPKENEEHFRHTKAKERRGETAKDGDRKEGAPPAIWKIRVPGGPPSFISARTAPRPASPA
jgi:hypothetical protein